MDVDVSELPPPKGLRPDTGGGLTVKPLPRTRASLETNLCRKGVYAIGHLQLTMPIDSHDTLGLVRAAGPPLLLSDVDTLAWLTEKWREGDRDPGGRVPFTLYELGRDMFGREPAGRERRLMRESFRRLHQASFELEGYIAADKATGRLGLVSEDWIHLLDRVRWLRRDGQEKNEAQLGGFIVEQLERGHLTYLDWRVLRALDGLGKRLWVFLESQSFKRSGIGEGAVRLWLGQPMYQALGITTRHAPHARRLLVRAGERVAAVDRSYRFEIVPPRHRGGTWAFTARRRLST